MNEQREAIAKAIHDAWNLSGVPYERGNIFKKDKRRSQADAVTAHLWNRADDPAVVEAVAESWNGEFWGVYRADEPEESREYPLDRPFTDAVDGSGYEISSMHMATAGSTPTPDELHDLARSSLAAALTALLGPRPSGEEAE